jgi:hypothetical protein
MNNTHLIINNHINKCIHVLMAAIMNSVLINVKPNQR